MALDHVTTAIIERLKGALAFQAGVASSQFSVALAAAT